MSPIFLDSGHIRTYCKYLFYFYMVPVIISFHFRVVYLKIYHFSNFDEFHSVRSFVVYHIVFLPLYIPDSNLARYILVIYCYSDHYIYPFSSVRFIEGVDHIFMSLLYKLRFCWLSPMCIVHCQSVYWVLCLIPQLGKIDNSYLYYFR